MHKVVTGLAVRRSIPISSPHSSHCPKWPSSILWSASRIFDDQLSFPVPDAEHEIPVRFKGRAVCGIREVLLVIGHPGHCFFGFGIELIQPLQKDFLEILLEFPYPFSNSAARF